MQFDAFVVLCTDLRSTCSKIGVEHFGRQFSEFDQLFGLGLDYLKLKASLVRSLEVNAGSQAFLKGLSTIAHGIALRAITEGVTSDAETQSLAAVDFDGAYRAGPPLATAPCGT